MDGTGGRGGLTGEDVRKERSARYAVLYFSCLFFFLPTPLCFSIQPALCYTNPSLSLPFPACHTLLLSELVRNNGGKN